MTENRVGGTIIIRHSERHRQQYRKPQKAVLKGLKLGTSYKRDLLTEMFNPKREGHDGAVIIDLFDGNDFGPR